MDEVSIKVAVVDDTQHVREMLGSMLALDGFEVVAEASSGAEAVKVASEKQPDVMIVDYAMPSMNGLEAAKQILDADPGQKIILYTAYLDESLNAEAQQVGVAVCLSKLEGLEILERNIAQLCRKLGPLKKKK